MGKKIFISYAREDAETARKMNTDLKQEGFEPWLDEENLLGGQNWREFIPQQIKDSDYVIMLLSTISVVKRDYVQVELKRTVEVLEEFPDFDIFVIPARKDDCELPYALESYNAVDLFHDYEKGLDRIIRALKAERTSDKKPGQTEIPSTEPLAPGIYISYALCDND